MRLSALSLPLAAIAIGLSACQSLTPEERRAADERQCLGYGFKRGTNAFATCLQRIDLDRRADARAFRLQADENFDDFTRPIYYPRYYRR
ncbi:hypothetical protein [Rhizobium sullae]|uniref:Lipoprotein n=1 Tax=Rhizobium sullae TaxID=50338 RepID=A0A2N0D265_RHISU|nr:hypothetical protein [Rhizobium sullae]PKA40194.1 hypothetical protein CWR43_26655 [Rhizobium sullae]TCU19157.1 hypothetical protein EV132_102386 [Rhizobium sullae]UWU14989.1 hypothetical protein N2599_02885 [Rhizobium sullae]